MSATAARVIFDSPNGGAHNMAVDQALLMSAEQEGIVTLRIYGWAEPTLSLGYFQKHTDRQLHSASLSCPLVRRRSGGGAILHDQELTYSLAIPSSNRWSNQNSELYDLVHRVVIQLLAEDGIESQLYKDAVVTERRSQRKSNRREIELGFGCRSKCIFVFSTAFRWRSCCRRFQSSWQCPTAFEAFFVATWKPIAGEVPICA